MSRGVLPRTPWSGWSRLSTGAAGWDRTAIVAARSVLRRPVRQAESRAGSAPLTSG